MNYLWWIYSIALEKSPKISQSEHILSILDLNQLVAFIFSQIIQFLPKMQIFVGGQIELWWI